MRWNTMLGRVAVQGYIEDGGVYKIEVRDKEQKCFGLGWL
jgi:hypothetical protein